MEGKGTNTKTLKPKETQLTLTDSITSFGNFGNASTSSVLIDWIIDGMHPISEVERPSFTRLWQTLTKNKRPPITVKTVNKQILSKHQEMDTKIILELSKVSNICIAADLWSAFTRSYLGVSCHWIDEDTLIRKKLALACKRVRGSHTYNILTEELQNIFKKFKIHNKITSVVTDNGSNFIKAFRVFGINDDEDDENINEESADEIDAVMLTDILDDVTNRIVLPPHRRCASHTLNLLASKDALKSLDKTAHNTVYRKVYCSFFGKCQYLWNKTHQSTVVNDMVEEKLYKKFIRPNLTRWNSTYDSVHHIHELFESKREEFVELIDSIGLQRFTKEEIEFCKVILTLNKV